MEDYDGFCLDFDDAINYDELNDILGDSGEVNYDVPYFDESDNIFNDMLNELRQDGQNAKCGIDDVNSVLSNGDSDTIENDSVATSSESGHFDHVRKNNSSSYVKGPKVPVSTLKKSRRVIWSVKNKTRGKTYEQYIAKQLKIARRIGSNLIKINNTNDVDQLNTFLDRYMSPDVVVKCTKSGYDPLEDETDTSKVLNGIKPFKTLSKAAFYMMPDHLSIVESIEVLNEGKLVKLTVTFVGTPIGKVHIPHEVNVENNDEITMSYTNTPNMDNGEKSSGYDATLKKSFANRGYMLIGLDKNNKINKLERYIDFYNH